ncbi:hypothetical protein [Nonomuraea sp. NEAU-A123]|uniref:hypothetical protein n=1 Tax=Nonomuraea sp. NEAU-A123 TaxID=2839649 RepID=UPI001BE49304|nr:hypothetical protein [Nonomuraea sp. NEAU-A123]MBT2233236.1 hypothetical protein [Nonomuraea sp. NEAU-A123]
MITPRLGAALATATLLVTFPQYAAAAAPPVTPECAWGVKVSADTRNVFYPDSAATYWVLPFTVQEGLRITLAGQYPDSRYASVQVYKEGGGLFEANGVASSLTDHRIQPDAGSVNPWQQQASPGGHYTLTVTADAAPGQVNTLPLAPSGTPEGAKGNIVYRVYLPADGDFSQVRLPAVTFERDGVTQPVPTCTQLTTSAAATNAGGVASATTPPAQEAGSATSAATPPAQGTGASARGIGASARGTGAAAQDAPAFARADLTDRPTGGFPNGDSAYLYADVTPPLGRQVVVIRGKAPRNAQGSHPAPWPAPGKDVRYWSMCTNLTLPPYQVVVNPLPDGTSDYGCRADDHTGLDSDGRYSYVVGGESQRQAIEQVPGVTFLPFSAARPAATHRIILRNMVVDAGFAEAVQNVPEDGDPASAAAVMGEYYPVTKVCSLAALTSEGPADC